MLYNQVMAAEVSSFLIYVAILLFLSDLTGRIFDKWSFSILNDII